jgi:hypothetical protein
VDLFKDTEDEEHDFFVGSDDEGGFCLLLASLYQRVIVLQRGSHS